MVDGSVATLPVIPLSLRKLAKETSLVLNPLETWIFRLPTTRIHKLSWLSLFGIKFHLLLSFIMKQLSLFLLLSISICLTTIHLCHAQVAAAGPLELTKAYQLSWNQEYVQAIQVFDEFLADHPENLDAKMGKAWTLAWSRQYASSRQLFQLILRQDKGQWEAHKGLAYLALWQENYLLAMQLFDKLIVDHPQEADLQLAAGLARVHCRFLKGARIHYKQLERLHATDAIVLLSAIQATPGYLEIESWGGISKQGGQHQIGLRAFRLGINPEKGWNAWLRYDNSLSLDGFSGAQANQPIPGLFVGGTLHPSDQLGTRLELGMRDLPNGGQSWLVMGEQSYWAREDLVVKAGGLFDFRSPAQAEHLLYGGFAKQIGQSLWIEPLYYRNFTQQRSGRQDRISLSAKYNWIRGNELQIGALYGWQLLESDTGSDPISGGWIRYQHPILKKHWIFALVRQENNPVNKLTVAAIGFRFKVEQ